MQNSCIFSIKDFHLYVTTTLLMSKNVGKWSEGIRLCFYSYCRVCDIVIICYTYVLLCGLPPSYRFLSVQFKMVSMRSEIPICAPPRLSDVFPMLPLKQHQCSSD